MATNGHGIACQEGLPVKIIISALALIGAALASGAATETARSPSHAPALSQNGGFGRGYSVFHSYSWARGTAGYGTGRCYWHVEACETTDE
jgi:hypothetical protein